MTFSVLQKKSETSYKFIELSKEKGEMVPALSPLLNHSIEISSDWCFTSLQDVVMTLWSGSTASSEPCSSPPVIFHISDYQLHLRQHQHCDTRSYSDCPRFSPAHRWDATRSVEEQERVELPEIHFFSPEADLLFFPPERSPEKERALPWKGVGLCRNRGWVEMVMCDVVTPNSGLWTPTTTFHSFLVPSAASNFSRDSLFDPQFPTTKLGLRWSSLKKFNPKEATKYESLQGRKNTFIIKSQNGSGGKGH